MKDQGDCGSCWAFSAVGALEGRFKIQNGTLIPLSIQQLIDCATSKYYGSGCNGGDMNEALKYAHDFGMEPAADYG